MAYIQADKETPLPNLTNQEIWHFIGDRGVYSASPNHMLSNFDVFVHSMGKLFYRMKLKKDVVPVNTKSCNTFFEGVTFHDPMECFVYTFVNSSFLRSSLIVRRKNLQKYGFIPRTESGDEVSIMPTHYKDDIDPSKTQGVRKIHEVEEAEELENETSISFEKFLALKLI